VRLPLSDSFAHPFFDFFLYPPDSSGTKLHPLGELPSRFEAGNVSEAIKNFLAYLLLRQKLHHELHCWRFANLGLNPGGRIVSVFQKLNQEMLIPLERLTFFFEAVVPVIDFIQNGRGMVDEYLANFAGDFESGRLKFI
jgi:hypothetical protein